MPIKTSWIEDDIMYVVSIRLTPTPIWISIDRMSVIVEKRTLSGNILEVWHLHIRHEDGTIIHRDKKYPP